MNNTLLICTVGGTPAPVAAAVRACKPDRIVFIPSAQTQHDVQGQILPLLAEKGMPLSPAQYKIVVVPDAQDFVGCVERMHGIEPEIRGWLSRGSDFQVIVDLTGGTKCMSAALALVSRRWQCRFSYIGGTERNKGGVGVVVDGKENVYHTHNPWDVLGYQVAEEAIVLFNKGDYQAAIDVLAPSLSRIEAASTRSELNSLKLLAEGYLTWDLFEHTKAEQKLKEVEKNINNLCHLISDEHQDMKRIIRSHLHFLNKFHGPWGQHTIIDLCANARRCERRGRYDDGVARLYRAVEAIAQLRLRDHHGIDTGNVPLTRLPEPLRPEWKHRARNGLLMLSLQYDYQLLEALGDELGHRFRRSALSGEKSLLNNRNQSILAHGFTPVRENVFHALYQETLNLAQIQEADLPEFPTLGPLT